MPAPNDPVKRMEWIRKNWEFHIGKYIGSKSPNYKPKVQKICPICGVIFEVKPSHAKSRVCCSKKCFGGWIKRICSGENNHMFGKHLSQQHKDKISSANIGRVQSEVTRKQRSESHKFVVHTKEWRANQSKALIGRKITWGDKLAIAHIGLKATVKSKRKMSESHRGERNPSWRGGVTPLFMTIRGSMMYAMWRTAIFERDDYRDWFSGVKGNGDLNVHHIVPFSILLKRYNIKTFEDAMMCMGLWDTNNGITMIESNHIAHHCIW